MTASSRLAPWEDVRFVEHVPDNHCSTDCLEPLHCRASSNIEESALRADLVQSLVVVIGMYGHQLQCF